MAKVPFIALFCVAYIAWWVGMAANSVGQPVNCSPSYTWHLPIAVLLVMAIPAALGYLWGRGERTQ